MAGTVALIYKSTLKLTRHTMGFGYGRTTIKRKKERKLEKIGAFTEIYRNQGLILPT